jgi:hypothetical protein
MHILPLQSLVIYGICMTRKKMHDSMDPFHGKAETCNMHNTTHRSINVSEGFGKRLSYANGDVLPWTRWKDYKGFRSASKARQPTT